MKDIVVFILKRWWPPDAPRNEQFDCYKAIKIGKKTSEWRDASDFWKKRLLTPQGLQTLQWAFEIKNRSKPLFLQDFPNYQWKHRQAMFVVGYTKYPRLIADIKAIMYHSETDQFEIQISNVVEEVDEK